jgi:uncharacterized hydrophobic protein (TIGR00271 family)
MSDLKNAISSATSSLKNHVSESVALLKEPGGTSMPTAAGSRAGSRHSRTTAQTLFPNETSLDPILTTKAMLVTVVTPRKVMTRRNLAPPASQSESERGTSATSAHGRHRKNVPSLGGLIDFATKGFDVVKASTAVPVPTTDNQSRGMPFDAKDGVDLGAIDKKKESDKDLNSLVSGETAKPVNMVIIKREEPKPADQPPTLPPLEKEEESKGADIASTVSADSTKPVNVVVVKREEPNPTVSGSDPPKIDDLASSEGVVTESKPAMMRRDEPPMVVADAKLEDLKPQRQDKLDEDDEIKEEAEGTILGLVHPLKANTAEDFVHPLKADKAEESASQPPHATMISSVVDKASLTGSFVKTLEERLAQTVAIKSNASTDEKDSKDDEDYVSPEEAAAVTAGLDPDESDINIEELLRISFQKLLEAGHLLNIPTYSLVLDRKDTTGSSWIRLDVMVKPNSLGIILERLERLGIGKNVGTLSVFKCELCKTASPYAHIDEDTETEPEPETQVATATLEGGVNEGGAPKDDDEAKTAEDEDAEEQEKANQQHLLEEARQEWKNAATRLRIEQVREQIVEQAELSFDFISLLSIASIIAGVGLVTNNTVAIVASMLISPIMGPVLGLTFGSRIRDFPLARLSLFNELIALLGCIGIGVLCGICAAFTPSAAEDWPTSEMEGRGDPIGLISGIMIAIPSGMGVCLSILGGNTSSLVGVAISASLLPPAVNAGVCLIYSILLRAGAVENDRGYTSHDFFQIGGVSFALTVLNIICIWASGILMFHIKEVAPTTEKNAFWDRDIKYARELNKEETPPPVNITKIREALKNILKKSPDEPPTPEPKMRKEVRRASMPAMPDRIHSPATVGNVFAMHPRQHSFNNPRLFSAIVEDAEDDDDIRYVGLEDMGNLLGFNNDEDEFRDPRTNVRRNHSSLSSGRYF